MEWKFDESRSIWQQITEQLSARILSGEFENGQRIPSVRELALDAGVNPNTMQRALLALDESGLTYADRTKGRIVTAGEEILKKEQKNMALNIVKEMIERLKAINTDEKEIINLVKEVLKDE